MSIENEGDWCWHQIWKFLNNLFIHTHCYNFDLKFFKTPVYPTDSTYTYVNFVLACTTSKNQWWQLTILVSLDHLQLVFLLLCLWDSALLVPVPALQFCILQLNTFLLLVISISILKIMTRPCHCPVMTILLPTLTFLSPLSVSFMVSQNPLHWFLLMPDSLLLPIMVLTKWP